jgi:hypothetical protein
MPSVRSFESFAALVIDLGTANDMATDSSVDIGKLIFVFSEEVGEVEVGFLPGETLHPGSRPDLLVVGCW